MSIDEQNKIIAGFMGWIQLGEDSSFYTKDANFSRHISTFEYHKNWNALIPVIEKISKWPLLNSDNTPCTDPVDTCHPMTFNMPTGTGRVMFRFKGFSVHTAERLIDACHVAVYEAIQWLNAQPK